VLFKAYFTELADDQFFTALAWDIAALQDTDDPGRVLKSRAVHQGQPRIKRGLCLSLVGALELLSAADWNIPISFLNLELVYSRIGTSAFFDFYIRTDVCTGLCTC
jgi:hypothetical protein